MAKLTLDDLTTIVGNEGSAVSTINGNNDAIETALENTLSRDGTSPNAMNADIDLNDNDLLNVGTLGADTVNAGALFLDGEAVSTVYVGATASWGSITGTLADQTDLQTALDAKPDALDDLSDVTITTPASGNILKYNGSAWVNDTVAAGAPADVDYLVKTASGSLSAERVVTDNSSITWDWASAGQVKANVREIWGIACSDETTALTTGTKKATFMFPRAFTVTAVYAGLAVAQTSGSTLTIDVNESNTTILSTAITIDNGETTSTTADVPPVVSDASIAAGALMSIDIDQIGDGTAKGLKVYIEGYWT